MFFLEIEEFKFKKKIFLFFLHLFETFI